MKTSDAITVKGAPQPVGSYPHARRAGGFLFLSGIGPRPPGGGPVPGVVLDDRGEAAAYEFEAQCHAVFANVQSVLEALGANLGDLVDVTVFLTDLKRDFAVFNRVYATYLDGDGPCRTTVEVGRLPTPIAIELKCIAYVGGR